MFFSIFNDSFIGFVVGFIGLIFSLKKIINIYNTISFSYFSISSISLKDSCLSRIERINFLESIDYWIPKK